MYCHPSTLYTIPVEFCADEQNVQGAFWCLFKNPLYDLLYIYSKTSPGKKWLSLINGSVQCKIHFLVWPLIQFIVRRKKNLGLLKFLGFVIHLRLHILLRLCNRWKCGVLLGMQESLNEIGMVCIGKWTTFWGKLAYFKAHVLNLTGNSHSIQKKLVLLCST